MEKVIYFNGKKSTLNWKGEFCVGGTWSGATVNQETQSNSIEVKLDKENSDKLKMFLENTKGSL